MEAGDLSDVSVPDVLERKFAIYVILSVKEMPGSTKSDIIKKDKGNERTKFLRISELIDEGIIMVDDTKRQHNSIKLYLTPKGQEMAKHLEKAVEAFEQTS